MTNYNALFCTAITFGTTYNIMLFKNIRPNSSWMPATFHCVYWLNSHCVWIIFSESASTHFTGITASTDNIIDEDDEDEEDKDVNNDDDIGTSNNNTLIIVPDNVNM